MSKIYWKEASIKKNILSVANLFLKINAFHCQYDFLYRHRIVVKVCMHQYYSQPSLCVCQTHGANALNCAYFSLFLRLRSSYFWFSRDSLLCLFVTSLSVGLFTEILRQAPFCCYSQITNFSRSYATSQVRTFYTHIAFFIRGKRSFFLCLFTFSMIFYCRHYFMLLGEHLLDSLLFFLSFPKTNVDFSRSNIFPKKICEYNLQEGTGTCFLSQASEGMGAKLVLNLLRTIFLWLSALMRQELLSRSVNIGFFLSLCLIL